MVVTYLTCRVGGETSTLIAELQATQRNVMKCLSEAEQVEPWAEKIYV